jgi:hypothetical protein
MKHLSLIILLHLCSSLATAQGQSGPLKPDSRQQAKTENLIRQVEELGRLASTNPQYDEYRAAVRRTSANLKGKLIRLPEGDIKTDLLTALSLYERVLSDWQELCQQQPLESRCANEKGCAELSLCQSGSGLQKESLWMKARRRTAWARAVIYAGEGQRDEALPCVLREMRAERELDLMSARKALAALRELQDDVIVYRSLGEFETGRSLARVSFESFTDHLRRISPLVKHMLARLPENRLKVELRNALLSYLDGGFWWSKVYRPAVINVSGGRFADGERPLIERAYLQADLYTVAINWRQGSQHLKRAEEMLDGLS